MCNYRLWSCYRQKTLSARLFIGRKNRKETQLVVMDTNVTRIVSSRHNAVQQCATCNAVSRREPKARSYTDKYAMVKLIRNQMQVQRHSTSKETGRGQSYVAEWLSG